MPVGPTVKRIGETYYVNWEQSRLVFEYSRLHDARDTLSAEVQISHLELGPLHWSRINLASASGRQTVGKSLEDSHPGEQWRAMLDRSCQLVAREYRKGEPAVALEATLPSEHRWLVEPWIPLGEITVLFGDGGAGKSLLALALGVSGVLGHGLGGPWRVADVSHVLYLDWESDRQTHAERLWALTAGLEQTPPGAILHRRLLRPLTDELASVKGDVDRHHPDLIVADSLGAACGPEPETADAAVRTLMGLRELPATKLVIAHVSKASADQSRSRPFGSVYVNNLARSVIEARRQDDGEDAGSFSLSLYHRKSNYGRLASASALTFEFGFDNKITVKRTDPDLASAGLQPQILEALKRGAKTVTDLHEETGAGEASLRVVLGRLENRNKVMRLDMVSGGRGKKQQWGLIDENRNRLGE